MFLSELSYSGFRNLHPDTLQPGSGVNLILGPNGAGKSSLLESVHLLGTGKSFRSNRNSAAVTWDQRRLSVNGKWRGDDAGGMPWQTSARAEGSETLLRLGTGEVSRLEMLKRFPLIFIGAESLHFFDEGPSFRRRQLDWGAFHVEHTYLTAWQRYRQALSQRNALLRSLGSYAQASQLDNELSPWETQMSEAAKQVSSVRDRFMSLLLIYFENLRSELQLALELKLSHRPGWDPTDPLYKQLEESRAKDARLGHTTRGPHRDDLIVSIGSRSALSCLSRGQQKTFMLCFFLALHQTVTECRTEPPLLLLDDLAAELDSERQTRVLELLSELKAQALVTVVSLAPDVTLPHETRVFHVEQGRIIK